MNERILLAEANPVLRGDYSKYFSLNHYTVESVANGTDALSSIAVFDPDLVILDTLLPGGGTELCSKIRQRSSVPIMKSTWIIESLRPFS